MLLLGYVWYRSLTGVSQKILKIQTTKGNKSITSPRKKNQHPISTQLIEVNTAHPYHRPPLLVRELKTLSP